MFFNRKRKTALINQDAAYNAYLLSLRVKPTNAFGSSVLAINPETREFALALVDELANGLSTIRELGLNNDWYAMTEYGVKVTAWATPLGIKYQVNDGDDLLGRNAAALKVAKLYQAMQINMITGGA